MGHQPGDHREDKVEELEAAMAVDVMVHIAVEGGMGERGEGVETK